MSNDRLHYIEVKRLADEIRKRVSLIDYLNDEGVKLYHAGSKNGAAMFSCCCPLHKENTPSFRVYEYDQSWYCFGQCISENELIWTSTGLKKIIDINIGDRVFDLNGTLSTVDAKKVHPNRETINFKAGSFKEHLCMTPDHTCFVVKAQDALENLPYIYYSKKRGKVRFDSRAKKYSCRKAITLAEIRAKDIDPGDFFAFPVISDDERFQKSLSTKNVVRKYSKGPKQFSAFKELPVDEEIAWLYGLWCAEGSCSGRTLRLTFHLNEKNTLAKRTSEIILKRFGLKSTISEVAAKNTCEVICSSVALVDLFSFYFGKNCYSKKIPFETLKWKKSIQKSFLNGHFAGDGTKSTGIHATVSKQLAYGIYALGIQAGMMPTLSFVPKESIKGKFENVSDKYLIYFKKRESLNGFFETINNTLYYLSKITSKKPGNIENVVDISVLNTKSFVTKMAVVHNCHRGGDVIAFAKEHKGFESWGKAVGFFASKLGLKAGFSDISLSELAYEDFLKTVCLNDYNELDANNINYLVSTEGKRICRKFNSPKVDTMIERIYHVLDQAIIDENQRQLSRIRYEILPNLKNFEKAMNERLINLNELKADNKLCIDCWLRYNCKNVVVGEGNPLANLAIIGDFPGEDEDLKGRPFVSKGKLLRQALAESGCKEESVWIDYISNCRPLNDSFQSELSFCKNKWLSKRLKLIAPDSVMLMGETAIKTFLGLKNVNLPELVNEVRDYKMGDHKIKLWFNYDPETENQEKFKSIVRNFVDKRLE